MPTQVQFRRGTRSQNNSFTGAAGELTVNSDLIALRVHDGSTAGGHELARADLSNTSGISTLTVENLYVTGVTTSSGGFFGDFTGNVNTTSGVSTFSDINISSDLDVDGHTILNTLNVSGASTVTSLDINGNVDIEGSIIPSTNDTFDLGSQERSWRDVYIGPGSLYINGKKVFEEDNNSNVVVSADTNQSVILKTTGSGNIDIDPTGSGNVQINGPLSVSGISTFSSDIDINASVDISDNLNVSGISTFASDVDVNSSVDISNNLNVSGVATFTSVTVNGDIGIGGSIIPDTDNTYDLGSPSKMWRDVYIGPGSLYVNGQKVIQEDSSNIVVSADENQNLVMQTSGDGDIELDPTGTGVVQIKGTLQIQDGTNITNSGGNPITFGNSVAVDSVSSRSTNTSLTLSGNGTGSVVVSDNLTVNGNLDVNGIAEFDGISMSGVSTSTAFHTGAEGSAIRISSNTITGPSTITLDPANVGDNTGTVIIKGNLQIDGTTTTVNSTTITVDDKNITLASGAANDAAADGGGITVESGDGDKTFTWVNSTDAWTSSEDMNLVSGKVYEINGSTVLSANTLGSGVVNSSLTSVGTLTNLSVGDVNSTGIVTATGGFSGDLTGNVTGDVTGNADTATTLETPRNIGGVSFDGSANIDLPGVNTSGNQDTSGNAATATTLETPRNIGGVSFDGSANIDLPGVNTSGNQDTSGNAATATALETSRTISLEGDVAGSVSFNGSQNVSINATIQSNSVALGDDTTGNYVATIEDAGNTNITVNNSGSENAAVTLDLTDTNVSSGSYGSGSEIPTFTVDAKGRLTAAGSAPVSTGMTVAGDSGSETINLLSETLTISGGTNLTSSAANNGVTVNLDDNISLSSVSASGIITATSGFDGDLTGDVTGTVSDISNHDTDNLSEGSNLYYTDERARSAISITDNGGDGSLSYNNSTGTISYTGPSAAEVRAHISEGTGVSISSGQISIGQAVETTSNVTFNDVAISNNATVGGGLTVTGDLTINGTTTTINSTTISVDDKNIELGATNSPSDSTANGGGITLKGTTDHTITWYNEIDSWSFSEHVNLEQGNEFKIGNVSVLSATTLGSNVINSSLTSVGTLGKLDVGNVDSTGIITATNGFSGDLTGNVTGDVTGNADTATTLETPRTIGGVSFDGSANINLPGVNTSGNQDTSGNAATATALETGRTIGGVSFDGTANIDLPGVNTSGNQDTSGTATNATNVTITNDISTNSTHYVHYGDAIEGNDGVKVSNTKLTFNPSVGQLTATNFNTTSDINLKEDIQPIENSSEILNQINPVKFKWKDNGNSSYGVIAQELETILPELVDGSSEHKSVNYTAIIPILIDIIKGHEAEIRELKESMKKKPTTRRKKKTAE